MSINTVSLAIIGHAECVYEYCLSCYATLLLVVSWWCHSGVMVYLVAWCLVAQGGGDKTE